MYNGYRTSPLENIRDFFRNRSALSQLIIINIIVFLAVNIIKLFFFLFQVELYPDENTDISKVIYWLAVPSSLKALAFKPWTIFTYMFLHENFFHILFNMFVLYFGGSIFSQFLDGRKLISTYIFGGIAGAVFFIISFNMFPVFNEHVHNSIALGASASVLAILVAIATYVPDFTVNLLFFGRVKLKYIALVLVIVDVLSISKGNPGGHIAHLGGALWGFIYIRQLKHGNDLSQFVNGIHLKRFFSWFYKRPAKFRFKNVHVNQRPYTDEEYNRIRAEKQQRIDSILEKISRSGYESLTKEEKALLFDASKKE